MAHYGHLDNHLPKCDRSFPECPQYIYSISAIYSSLICRKVMLTVRSGCWEPCTCCPDRDQSRSSPGRGREMCEVCVQRHCCAVPLTAFLPPCPRKRKAQQSFPGWDPTARHKGVSQLSQLRSNSCSACATAVPSASPCACAALQLRWSQ